jgi:hypothetical protein
MRWLCKGAGVLSFFIVAVYVAAGRLTIFMPGPLPAVHQNKIGANCGVCHRSWNPLTSGTAHCISEDCHWELTSRNTHGKKRDMDCARCHVEHAREGDVAAAIRQELQACPVPPDPANPEKARPQAKPLAAPWQKRPVDLIFRHAPHVLPVGKEPGQECEACHAGAAVVPMPIHARRAAKKKCVRCHGAESEVSTKFSGETVISVKTKCVWCHHVKDDAH